MRDSEAVWLRLSLVPALVPVVVPVASLAPVPRALELPPVPTVLQSQEPERHPFLLQLVVRMLPPLRLLPLLGLPLAVVRMRQALLLELQVQEQVPARWEPQSEALHHHHQHADDIWMTCQLWRN